MASSDSRSNRSLWSACGINIRRRLFLCSPEVAHCMRFELRYCTHTTLSVQSRGRSLHWGLSWGIAHTRLFLCSPEVAHCTGVWVEVLHTHDSFCAVQRSFVALGPAAIHRRNHAASFSLVLSIALTLHTFLSCTPKKTKTWVVWIMYVHASGMSTVLYPDQDFTVWVQGRTQGDSWLHKMHKSISGKHELSYKDSRCDSAL